MTGERNRQWLFVLAGVVLALVLVGAAGAVSAAEPTPDESAAAGPAVQESATNDTVEPAIATGTISGSNIINTVDNDGDGYARDFDIEVYANTDIDVPIYRQQAPYFRVKVGGQKVTDTSEVEIAERWFEINIPQSELDGLNLNRGSATVQVELRDERIGTGDPLYDDISDSAQYEPESEDRNPQLSVDTQTGGSVTVDPPGIIRDQWTDTYSEGTTVELSPSSQSDYVFAGWQGDVPSGSASDETITVTMDQDRSITATFQQIKDDHVFNSRVIDRVDNDGDGYARNFDVEVYADTDIDVPIYRQQSPYFVVEVGGQQVAETDEVQIAEQWFEIGLSKSDLDGLNLNRGSVGISVELRDARIGTGDPLYDAISDSTQYEPETDDRNPELSVDTQTGGSVSVDPPGVTTDQLTETYSEGTDVQLSPSSQSGYVFDGWQGDIPDGTAGDETITVTMNGDRSVTATYKSIDDAYITDARLTNRADDDGDGYYADFDVEVDADTNIDVPIYRQQSPYFVVMAGGQEIAQKEVEVAQRTFDISLDQADIELLDLDRGSVAVTVELRDARIGTSDPLYDDAVESIQYEQQADDAVGPELSVVAEDGGGLGIDPPGVNTGQWTETYEEGTEVELRALANSGKVFDGWAGNIPAGSADDRVITVTMDQDRSITATFRNVSSGVVVYDFDTESVVAGGSSGTSARVATDGGTTVESESSDTATDGGLAGETADDGQFEPESVIGSQDNRSRVPSPMDGNSAYGDTTRAIVQVGSFCSGTVIDEYHVLTAGHCVYSSTKNVTGVDNNGDPIYGAPEWEDGPLTVRPATDSHNSTTQVFPYSKVGVELARIYESWYNNEYRRDDFAVLTLNRSVGTYTGTVDYTAYDRGDAAYDQAAVVGYPGDRDPYPSLWEDDGSASVGWGPVRGSCNIGGSLLGCYDQIMTYELDTGGGQSGSPVLNNDGGQWETVGVHVAAGSWIGDFVLPSDYNLGVRVTPQKESDVDAWIDEDDSGVYEEPPTDYPAYVHEDLTWTNETGDWTTVSPSGSVAATEDQITLEHTIRNVGTASTNTVEVAYALTDSQCSSTTSADRFATQSVSAPAPFETTTVTWSGTIPEEYVGSGQHICAELDPDDAIAEYGRWTSGFNDYSVERLTDTPVDVLEPADDALFEVSIDGAGSTTTATAGDDLTLVATVENTGDRADEQTITLDADPLGTDSTTASVAGGASTTVSLSVSTSEGDAGSYTATVESENTTAAASDQTGLSVEAVAPASLAVTVDTAASTLSVTEGDDLTLVATVENTGDTSGQQTITLDAGALGTDSTTVSLASNASTTVSLSVSTSAGDAGDYTATVSSANDSATASVSVSGGELPLPPLVGDTLPQDLNGDGLYEDVRGSGEVTILDVQVLFNYLGTPVMANHTSKFNFQGNDNEINILDVQELFNQHLVDNETDDNPTNETGTFTAESQGGFVAINESDESTARQEGFSLPPSAEVPDPVVVDADLADNGTWESTSVDFPPLDAAGLIPDGVPIDPSDVDVAVSVPNGFEGELDRDAGRMTVAGLLRIDVTISGTELTLDVQLDGTTDQSGSMTGSFQDNGDSVSATIVDNEFAVDSTGQSLIDSVLGLPAPAGSNWLELELQVAAL